MKYNLFLARYADLILSHKSKEVIKGLLYSSQDLAGVLFFNTDLNCFLTEVYACINEYRYMKMTLDYFSEVPKRFKNFFLNPKTKVIDLEYDTKHKTLIAENILSMYNIRDPKIASLTNYLIYQILHSPISKISNQLREE